ncbi:MAG: transcriptional repressor [Bacteroidales bacterium]|nr:transcriptional repressor [Bacteroidales bacterium]
MDATVILRKHKLSKTTGRIEVLKLFIESDQALSEREIHSRIEYSFDRASIYRTLKTFSENGILHPVYGKNEMTKYILQQTPEEHLHFKCSECEKVMCLPEIKFNDIHLPEGFIKKEANYLVIGICDNCNL